MIVETDHVEAIYSNAVEDLILYVFDDVEVNESKYIQVQKKFYNHLKFDDLYNDTEYDDSDDRYDIIKQEIVDRLNHMIVVDKQTLIDSNHQLKDINSVYVKYDM